MPDQEAALAELAQRNLAERIAANPYPGRGIVAGRLAGGDWLMLYWIMGRSANSRNRRFTVEPNGVLRTAPPPPGGARGPDQRDLPRHVRTPRRRPRRRPRSPGRQPRSIHHHERRPYRYARRDTFHRRHGAGRPQRPASAKTTRPHYTPPESPPSWTSAAPPTASRSNYRSPSSAPTRSTPKPPTASSGASPNPPNNTATASTPTPQTATPSPPSKATRTWFPLAGTPREIATAYWNHLDQDNRIALAAKQIKPDSQSEIHLAAPNLLP